MVFARQATAGLLVGVLALCGQELSKSAQGRIGRQGRGRRDQTFFEQARQLIFEQQVRGTLSCRISVLLTWRELGYSKVSAFYTNEVCVGMVMTQGTISLLPPGAELESRSVLNAVIPAYRYLAELKGMAGTISSEHNLTNTFALQEAKDSSEIGNIVTTHDDLYKADPFSDYINNPDAKEVSGYTTAVQTAIEQVKRDRLLTINRIVEIHRLPEQDDAGIRRLPATALRNEHTGVGFEVSAKMPLVDQKHEGCGGVPH